MGSILPETFSILGLVWSFLVFPEVLFFAPNFLDVIFLAGILVVVLLTGVLKVVFLGFVEIFLSNVNISIPFIIASFLSI